MKIVFDAECTVCQGFKDFALKQKTRSEFTFIPYQDGDLEKIFPSQDSTVFEKSLFLLNNQGEVYQGARAVFRIMSEFRGSLGFFGKILSRPPFYWIAEPFYRLFAHHRHCFFKRQF
jgi:predicted DCC family thiol-disulfide oxidoreductase YuxK